MPLRLINRQLHGTQFVGSFFEFAGRCAVGHDAAGGLQIAGVADHDEGANGDARVHLAIEREVAHGPAVDAAPFTLQLLNDLHGAHLGRAGERAGRERSPQHIEHIEAVADFALHFADDVHDVRVAFDDHKIGHMHAAEFGNPAHIVAAKIDQHDMLGALLRVAEQLVAQCGILGIGLATAAGAGNRPYGGNVVLVARVQLGRCADDAQGAVRILHLKQAIEVEVEHPRRGVDAPQAAIDGEGMRLGAARKPARHLDLKGVPPRRCNPTPCARPLHTLAASCWTSWGFAGPLDQVSRGPAATPAAPQWPRCAQPQ